MASILAVIPARRGSKGLPWKNIRPLAGKPLLAYTAEAARACKMLDAIVLSTDCEEVAAVGRTWGIEAPFLRPPHLASDQAQTAPVLCHAVEWFEATQGCRVSAVVTLQPTTPLRNPQDIDHAVNQFVQYEPKADSLISVCKAGVRHPLTLYEVDEPYLASFTLGKNPTTRRQEFACIYLRNGSIYITNRDYLFENGRVVSDQPLFYEMPRCRSINIDDLFDFTLAELFLRHQRSLSEAEGVL